MEAIQTNATKQWKKQLINGLTKSLSRNFSESSKKTTRNEIPNKYNTRKVPKIEIEQVYHLNLLKKSKSISARASSMPGSPTETQKSPQKPFYYSPNNEILSLEEFLQVHKDMKVYRKKQDKIALEKTIMEKRFKIEEAYQNKGLASLTASRSSDMQPLSTTRPFSSQTSRKVSVPQIIVSNTSKNPLENLLLDQNYNLSTPKTGNVTDRVLTLNRGLSVKTSLDMNALGLEDVVLSSRDITSSQPNSARGFTTNQKFTHKEIAKHLLRGTVSPKPPRYGGKSAEREKTYIRMFRNTKTMDLAVEASIKKARKIINSQSKNSEMSKENSVDFQKSKKIQDIKFENESVYAIKIQKDLEIKVDTLENEGEKKDEQLAARMIRKSIRNIDLTLSTTTPRLLVGIFNDDNGPKTERRKSGMKTLLRSEVEQKYEFSQRLEQNRKLSTKIKDVTNALKKGVPASWINNQNYVGIFN